MKGYFQTWAYVAKISNIPLIGGIVSKTLQFICGLFGHELSKTEWGYGGGDTCDRWCRWCNKLIVAPKTSVQFAFKEDADLMKEIK